MADYKFNKPWAAESQNVQEFTEEEWGTGIVEKSLVSSSQVNGVMQAVTRRFLDLEAVEDRQYRYDFVVEDEVSWQKFVSGDIGDARSVLIRKGKGIWSTEKNINLSSIPVEKITIEAGAAVSFSGGLMMAGSNSSRIDGGGIQGTVNIVNARLEGTNISSPDITLTDSYISNSFFYGGSGSLTGGKHNFCRYSIVNAKNAQFDSCLFTRVSELNNCTLVRCAIPNNTKLTYCTVIDCSYTVDKFVANLVTGTTFRNCNITFTTTTEETGAVCNSTNKAYGSTIEFHLAKSEHVSMIIYDSRIIFYRASLPAGPLYTDSQFFGTSYIDASGASSVDIVNVIKSLGAKGSIITDIPFFRDGENFCVYNPTSIVYPGIINIIPNNDSRTLLSYSKKQKFFLNFTGDTNNTLISYGRFKFIPWCRATKSITDDSYNIEFIAGSESEV